MSPVMPSTPRYDDRGAAPGSTLTACSAPTTAYSRQPRGCSTWSPTEMPSARDSITSPTAPPCIALPSSNGATYDFWALIRPRMYGSTERYVFRTSTWPSRGAGSGDSTSAKSSGFGQPTGRLSRCHSRLTVVVVIAESLSFTSVPETTVQLNISCCQVKGYAGGHGHTASHPSGPADHGRRRAHRRGRRALPRRLRRGRLGPRAHRCPGQTAQPARARADAHAQARAEDEVRAVERDRDRGPPGGPPAGRAPRRPRRPPGEGGRRHGGGATGGPGPARGPALRARAAGRPVGGRAAHPAGPAAPHARRVNLPPASCG
ncbi:hypothetical protein SGPA1_30839 [Streptomyces misionensis JCM 4497]